ncbi:MAG: mechanosensitive ion channel family protein [Gammaproteobacteria bacterium]|nr:mechanosensitive ion channel family protein [Gammaproteobacteria bacterium]
MNPIEILRDQLATLSKSAIEHTPNLVAAALLVIVTWLVAKLARRVVNKLLSRQSDSDSLTIAVRKLAVLFVWVAGMAMTAIVLFPSVEPGSMLAGLGLGSVAIGFAFKDIFENFFAGMLILFRQPFRIGDFVEVDGIEGHVENITIRDTRLRQTDGQPVIVPNSTLFKEAVTVRTDKDRRRVRIICGVAYDENLDEARDVITKAVEKVNTVIDDQPVQVFAQEFGGSSIDFEVTWWTGSKPVDVRRSRDEVIASIKAALDDAGIEIPFPYRTMTFKEPLSLLRRGADDEQEAAAA